jgi:hypothetical protein
MTADDDILKALDAGTFTSTRSTLVAWMKRNRDAFAARLEGKRADWVHLADLFAKNRLLDAKGNPPKPETARKAWQRVQAQGKAPRPTNRPITAEGTSNERLGGTGFSFKPTSSESERARLIGSDKPK